MTKRYKLAILIGRFQPLHMGHRANIRSAFMNVADEVQILIGSSFQPRTPKNPFTYQERFDEIQSAIGQMMGLECEGDLYRISPLRDYKYSNNTWIAQVQSIIKENWPHIPDEDIAILGYDKDESSWYNHAFPSWTFVPLPAFTNYGSHPIDATKVRELYFEGHVDFLESAVGDGIGFLEQFSKTPEYTQLVEEYNYIKKYKKDWAVAPYPPTFFCTDAVVVQGGHILLIQRGFSPGKGLWALPGGFLNQKEKAFDGCLRELVEETRIKVPEIVMRKALVHQELFDDPERSLRGRTLSQAFLFHLDGGDGKLPKVKPADDAKNAKWFKLSELADMSAVMFEDHLHIINTMLGRIKQ
jgi:bifunctional NMN adenylyltransferase/nudix hydrolase